MTPKGLYWFIFTLILGSVLRFSGAFLKSYETLALIFFRHISNPLECWFQLERHLFPHLRYFFFNSWLLAFVLVFKKPIVQLLATFIVWFMNVGLRKEKKLILVIMVMVLAVFLYKIHLGFWHKGVGGWTYHNLKTNGYKPEPGLSKNSAVYPDFLKTCLNEKAAASFHKELIIPGDAMFLHYSTGEVLPFNFELLNMSWASKIFNAPHGPKPEMVGNFKRILMNSLRHKAQGKTFILNDQFSYPNHRAYVNINYKGYPDCRLLEKISFWKVSFWFRPGLKPEIMDATLFQEITV